MDALNNCFSTITLIVCRVYNASSERTDAPCRRNLGLVTSQNANKLQKRLLPFANVFHHFILKSLQYLGVMSSIKHRFVVFLVFMKTAANDVIRARDMMTSARLMLKSVRTQILVSYH